MSDERAPPPDSLFGPALGEPRRLAQRILHWAQQGECVLCGEALIDGAPEDGSQSATFDHIVPRVQGGDDKLFNLALAHERCNVARGAAPLSATQQRRIGFRELRLREFLAALGVEPQRSIPD